MKIKRLIELFSDISIYKTLRFNLHYFTLSVAIHFPVVVNKSVEFHDLRGGRLSENLM